MSSSPPPVEAPPPPSLQIDGAAKKKRRRLRGTPDPEAEVVALSPPALLGWNRWRVCESCGWRGLRRHQSLRRYVVPSSNKLRERDAGGEAPAWKRKLAFLCPEPGCRYHAPCRALADLPSLQKHFRRKHGRHGLWACGLGSGACDACGRVISRPLPGTSPATASGGGFVLGLATAATSTSQQPSQLHEIVVAASPSSQALVVSSAMASPTVAGDAGVAALGPSLSSPTPHARPGAHNLELQLIPAGGSCGAVTCCAPPLHPPGAAMGRLDLSLGNGGARERDDAAAARLMVEGARQQLLLAMAEKEAAEEDRVLARRRAELAGLELASAQRMRQRAQVELSRAIAARQLVSSRLLQAAASSTPVARAAAVSSDSEVGSYAG